MNEFFNPKTVAVIGVSSSPDNLACNILANLIEFNFKGTVYEVGIRGGVCFGRKIYRSVTNISDHIDLAVILTPARTISGILRDCGKKGIKHVIIESAGFGEYGQEGQKLDKELLDIAKKYGIKFIGPNCIGAMNLHNGLALSFTAFKNVFRKGSVSIVTQSGGVGISYLNLLSSENIGLGKFASIGNKLNINENDILEYLIHDPETEIICLYLESISDGRRLMDIALRSSKPILLHKANIGREAMDIAQSHTASLSSDDAVVSAALKQAGIARFKDPETMLNYLKILPLAKVR
ncbi:MAG: acetyl-CoA synthetase, partial [Deltaproteobacteria bacterium CG07_land_8_20_14_0_80_38_7]